MVDHRSRLAAGSRLSRADLWGLGACALGVAVLVPGLLSSGSSTAASTTTIAETTFALAGVRRRPSSALVWDDLAVGEILDREGRPVPLHTFDQQKGGATR